MPVSVVGKHKLAQGQSHALRLLYCWRRLRTHRSRKKFKPLIRESSNVVWHDRIQRSLGLQTHQPWQTKKPAPSITRRARLGLSKLAQRAKQALRRRLNSPRPVPSTTTLPSPNPGRKQFLHTSGRPVTPPIRVQYRPASKKMV